MHKVRHHEITSIDRSIEIKAVGNPDQFGAHEQYAVTTTNPATVMNHTLGTIQFQAGNRFKVGINGLTDEVLLAILIDRLDCLQEGPLACEEFFYALNNIRTALETLNARTRERIHNGDWGAL